MARYPPKALLPHAHPKRRHLRHHYAHATPAPSPAPHGRGQDHATWAFCLFLVGSLLCRQACASSSIYHSPPVQTFSPSADGDKIYHMLLTSLSISSRCLDRTVYLVPYRAPTLVRQTACFRTLPSVWWTYVSRLCAYNMQPTHACPHPPSLAAPVLPHYTATFSRAAALTNGRLTPLNISTNHFTAIPRLWDMGHHTEHTYHCTRADSTFTRLKHMRGVLYSRTAQSPPA